MVSTPLALQHDGTPEVAVIASIGDQARVLRLLRTQDAALPPRWLAKRMLCDHLARTVRQFGARPLRASAEAPLLADATTLHGLGRQVLRRHTVDGDATQTLADSAGRSLWSCNAQGTVWLHAHEPPNEGGRLLAVSEQPAGGPCRQRERLQYGEPVLANRERNLAGELTTHFDNAGVMHVRSLSLGALALETQRRLLHSQAQQPDWAVDSEDELEQPLLMTHQYDAGGALLVQVNAASVTRRMAYDISGAVAQAWMAQGAANILVLSAIQRRADGVPLAQTAGNGVVDTFDYSARSQRLTCHRTARPSDHALGALVISDLHYRYDPVGNILTLDDQGADPAWHRNTRADGLRTYAYDTLYRLVSASGRERTSVAGTWAPGFAGSDRKGGDVWGRYTEHYSYDDGDNLTELSHNGGAGSRSRKLVVSEQSNRALPEGHDLTPDTGFLAGGLQKALADGRPLTWYADNQFRQVSLVRRPADADDLERYYYADGGTRTRKVTTVKVADGLQTTVITYAGGCETRRRQREGRLQEQVVITEDATVRWIQTSLGAEPQQRYGFIDHLGSSSGETDALGRLVARQEYSPYGETTGSDEDIEEVNTLLQRTLRYSGKERDATGFYYYGWRYYQPEFGRWSSADPGGLIDGLNLFRMVRNNPVTLRDGTGLNPRRALSETSLDHREDGMLQQGGLEVYAYNSQALEVKNAALARNISGALQAAKEGVRFTRDVVAKILDSGGRVRGTGYMTQYFLSANGASLSFQNVETVQRVINGLTQYLDSLTVDDVKVLKFDSEDNRLAISDRGGAVRGIFLNGAQFSGGREDSSRDLMFTIIHEASHLAMKTKDMWYTNLPAANESGDRKDYHMIDLNDIVSLVREGKRQQVPDKYARVWDGPEHKALDKAKFGGVGNRDYTVKAMMENADSVAMFVYYMNVKLGGPLNVYSREHGGLRHGSFSQLRRRASI